MAQLLNTVAILSTSKICANIQNEAYVGLAVKLQCSYKMSNFGVSQFENKGG